jgi:hypothetical protein
MCSFSLCILSAFLKKMVAGPFAETTEGEQQQEQQEQQ